jgi:hypothetical protein
MSNLVSSLGDVYSTVVQVNHEIKWWAIILCGLIIRAAFKAIESDKISGLSNKLQTAVANFIYFTIIFCTVLIVVQFQPYFELFFNYVFEFFEDILR